MCRLAILFSFSHIILVQGLVRHTVDLSQFYDNDLNPVSKPRDEVKIVKSPIWVLDLNTEDLDALKLRVGSDNEDREFEYAVGGNIREIERRQRLHNNQVKKVETKTQRDVSENKVESFKKKNERLKKEIVKFVNKLILSTINLNDPAYDFENEPSVSIYFKGPYSSLAVKTGNKQWHYFLKPPSPLPAWFYTDHPTGGVVQIPFSLRNTFLAALSHLLKMFLGFPV